MMKKQLKQTLLLALLLPTFEVSQADDWTGHISGYLGQKQLDDADWSPLEKQLSLGVIFDIKRESWPVSIAYDIIGSADVHESGALKNEAYTVEHHLGIRKIFDITGTSVTPYVGGGVALIDTEIKNRSATTHTTESDDSTGLWVGGGVYVPITSNVNLGVDVRYSQADVTFANVDRKAGGMHWGITTGYAW
ncbi:MAG: outer membrane beta-barrel protein [Halopseudomonas sp.]